MGGAWTIPEANFEDVRSAVCFPFPPFFWALFFSFSSFCKSYLRELRHGVLLAMNQVKREIKELLHLFFSFIFFVFS